MQNFELKPASPNLALSVIREGRSCDRKPTIIVMRPWGVEPCNAGTESSNEALAGPPGKQHHTI